MSQIQKFYSETSLLTRFVLAVLTIAIYYYVYRYALQYNDENTSPTYTATPTIFKYGKYLLLLLVYLHFVLKGRIVTVNRKFGMGIYLYIVLFNSLLLLRLIIFGEIDTLKLMTISIIPLIYIKVAWSELDFCKIEKFLYKFYVFAIIYELVQLFLFFTQGRLPALAYEDSISVRFGGPWDDPNGWGISLSFFIPFVYYYTAGLKKKVLVVIGILMLIASQSLTAIGAFICSCSLAEYMIHKKRRVLYLCIAFVVAFISYLFCEFFLSNSFIIDYMEMKQGSIDDHANSLSIFSDFEWYNYLIGIGTPFFNESDYSNMLCFGGILMLLLYFMIALLNISQIYRIIKRQEANLAFWKGVLTFQIAFLIASVNLPCTRMFYLYVLFNVFLCISGLGQQSLGKSKSLTPENYYAGNSQNKYGVK